MKDLSIEERFEDVTNIFNKIHGILGLGGLWPLARSNFYIFWTIAYVTNGLCGFAYLLEYYKNLIVLACNLSEIFFTITLLVKVLSLQFSKCLPKLLIVVMDGMKSVKFNNDEERDIYLIYASRGKSMSKFALIYIISAAVVYFIKPLMNIFMSAFDSSSTIILELPYAIEPFVNYTDYRIFTLIYLIQSSCLIMDSFLAADIALYYMICFHCCGKLAVLRYRIKQIDYYNVNSKETTSSTIIFKNLVEYYVQCLDLIKDVDGAYQISLFQDLIGMTGVLALTLYTTIMNLDDLAILVACSGFASGSCLYLYGNCLIGEILIEESMSVSEAYYDIAWYNLPVNCQKFIPLCIAGSSKPMKQTAWGVFDYSMTNFAAIIKSAMAYLSMLRNVT